MKDLIWSIFFALNYLINTWNHLNYFTYVQICLQKSSSIFYGRLFCHIYHGKPVIRSSSLNIFTVEWSRSVCGHLICRWLQQAAAVLCWFCRVALWPTDTTDPYFLQKHWHLGQTVGDLQTSRPQAWRSERIMTHDGTHKKLRLLFKLQYRF